MPQVSPDALQAALTTVIDPEIRKPVTELGMVESVAADADGRVAVTILLTVAASVPRDEHYGVLVVDDLNLGLPRERTRGDVDADPPTPQPGHDARELLGRDGHRRRERLPEHHDWRARCDGTDVGSSDEVDSTVAR